MSTSLQLRVLPQVAYDAANLRADVAQRLGVDPQQIHAIRTVKRSIDARQRQVMVNLTLEVFVDEDPTTLSFERIHYGDVSAAPQAIVVGAGPGGLFAALRLVELGVRPIVLERGRDVDGRKKDLAAISRDHIVDSESNYSTWRQHRHPSRCPSPHRHRPLTQHHPVHARTNQNFGR